MRIIGYIAALTLIALAMGDVADFIDSPALGLVLGFAVWGFLASAGCSTGKALRTAFSGSVTDQKALQTAIRAVRSSRHAALAGGFVAVSASLVLMLKNMGDAAKIGPGMALGLLGFMWAAVVAYVLLLPLQAGMEHRIQTGGGEEAAPSEMHVDLLVVGAGFLVTLITFAILMFSISLRA